MKKQFAIIKIICMLSLLGHPIATLAASTENFNPNFLISDEELQDYSSMNRSDIQAFLNEQSGILSNFSAQDKDGTLRTASDIIYRAAKDHRINPKYLLVKLQKEQSLISDQNPTQKQLDGATGYGITDGCGWTCETYYNNKGFGKQVSSAAGIMRWYYDNMDTQKWIRRQGQTFQINNETITAQSDATGFLYTYTPHILGNKNFWLLWQRWFSQVYPNGTLVKTTDNPTVYLIKDGEKRAFRSLTALTTRFDPKNILTISNSELSRYTTGSDLLLPNYSILQQGSNYYLLDDDRLRQFESKDTVRQLGYHPDEIIQVTADDLRGYETGKIISSENESFIGQIIKAKGSGNIYYYKDNTLYPVSDPIIATVNYPNQPPVETDIDSLNNPAFGPPMLFKNGTLILIPGSNHVYVIEDGKKRHIVSEKVFEGLGYKWENIITTTVVAGMVHPTGQPLYLRSSAPPANNNTTIADRNLPETVTEQSTETNQTNTDIKNLMQRTAENEWKFVGTKFDTDMDSYLVLDVAEENIVLGKNIDVVRPMASLAKPFSLYKTMQKGLRLNQVQTYNPSKHKAIYHRYRIIEGEKVFNRDLLDAALVSSLNTPVKMLVDAVEKDEPTFIRELNQNAKLLGANNTTFTSVTGETESTVTTAKDYMTLFMTALSSKNINDSLQKTTYRYTQFKDLDDKPNHFDNHSNALHKRSGKNYTILASKTGYLWASGANLAMLVERNSDKKQFLIIALGNADFENRFDEPHRLAEHVMKNY